MTKSRPSPRRLIAALVAWVGVILVATLVPIGGENELHLVPFQELVGLARNPGDLQQWRDAVGNVLLFVPLGAMISWRSQPRLRQAVVAGLGLSTTIEFLQLFIPGRWTSTDDVLLNTSGAALGYLAGRRVAGRRRLAAK